MMVREKLRQRALSPYFSRELAGKRGGVSQNDSGEGREGNAMPQDTSERRGPDGLVADVR